MEQGLQRGWELGGIDMRLIDADILIEKLKSYAECDWNKSLCVMLPSVVYDYIEFVDEQPTAYSVDKLVDELEKSKDKGSVTKTEMLITKACVDEAIKIVKHGGVSDYLCEWKLDGDNLTTGCGDYFNLYDNCTGKFKYCPRCGKKIMVVE